MLKEVRRSENDLNARCKSNTYYSFSGRQNQRCRPFYQKVRVSLWIRGKMSGFCIVQNGPKLGSTFKRERTREESERRILDVALHFY